MKWMVVAGVPHSHNVQEVSLCHYSDVIMSKVASQITSLTIVQPLFFRHRSKRTPKLRVTGLFVGNSPVTGEFTVHRASNEENVSFDDVIMASMIIYKIFASVFYNEMSKIFWLQNAVVYNIFDNGQNLNPLFKLKQNITETVGIFHELYLLY